MRKNPTNFVSVKVDDEVLHRVHRPVAMRFSRAWNRVLRNPKCQIVTATFPPDPPAAPLVSQPAPSTGNAPSGNDQFHSFRHHFCNVSGHCPFKNTQNPFQIRSVNSKLTTSSGSAPAQNSFIPPPPPLPSYKDALKFIIQWMEGGGADPKGRNAVPYPSGYRAGLERLMTLVCILEVDELITRINRDLGMIPVPRPKKCPVCRRTE